MPEALGNLVVPAIIAFTVGLAIFTVIASRKKKAGAQSAARAFDKWLTAQNFTPDHLSSFSGTGIAFRQDDNRIALQARGTFSLVPIPDIISVRSYQTTGQSRPLGAAPGVVEVRMFQVYNLELILKDVATPVRIVLETEDDMRACEQRLNALIGAR